MLNDWSRLLKSARHSGLPGTLGFPSSVILATVRGPEDASGYQQLDLDGRRQAERQSTGGRKPCPAYSTV